MATASTLRVLIAGLAAALVLSCGSNNSEPDSLPVFAPPGSGNSYTSASLTGNYWATTFATSQDPDNYRSSMDGYAFGGTGYATYSLKAADRLSGVVLDSSNASYSVNPDGTFTLSPTGYAGLSGALGTTALGAYSELGVMSGLGSFSRQAASVMIRTTATTHSNSSLMGAYYFASMRDYSSEAGTRVSVGSAVSDGAGVIDITATALTYGSSAIPVLDGMSYYVSSNGTITATSSADLTALGGALCASRNVAALSSTVDRNRQEVYYMVKAPSSAMTNANLAGTYFMSSSYRGFYNGWGSALRKYTFDGAGNVSIVSTFSESLTGPAQSRSQSGSYSMNADGTFTITADSITYTCGLGSDGSAFIAASAGNPLYMEAGLAIKQ